MPELISRLTDAHLLALGKVVANFSQLEDELARLIWAMLGPDEQLGQTVTAELSFKAAVNLAGSLARHRTADASLLATVEDALKAALKAEEQRNIHVHSAWFGVGENGVVRAKITAKRDAGRKVQWQTVAPEAIEAVATRLAEATYDVMAAHATLRRALP